jgi:alkyl sulfatase BDS1-like metallo-beta-lactamase superfamily hydrolase
MVATGPSFEDRTDFENADRGLVDAGDPVVIKAADGRIVFDLTLYSYLDGECPDTVHPSLWRQAQLCAKHGLFEVTGGIYQVRGYDLSNMTLVEGETGVIVIDPLISAETAAAALALYRKHRGDKPVVGVIYSHSQATTSAAYAACSPMVPGRCRSLPRRASWSTRSRRTCTPEWR